MRKFRKKPVIVEAFQFHSVTEKFVKWAKAIEFNNWCLIENVQVKQKPTDISINTLEGMMKVSTGDWIIKGVNGEFYPCKPDIFDKTYEYVD